MFISADHSLDLKTITKGVHLISRGRLLHNLGSATAQPPLAFSQDGGTAISLETSETWE